VTAGVGWDGIQGTILRHTGFLRWGNCAAIPELILKALRVSRGAAANFD
jgi:hypothetical protein